MLNDEREQGFECGELGHKRSEQKEFMFVTAVCVLFLIKLRWPKKKNLINRCFFNIYV